LSDTLLERLLFFLERPSVIGSEELLCNDLEDRLRGVQGWRVERAANNLVLRREDPDLSRPRLVFAGHIDTVPEPEPPIEVRVEGEVAFGRGSSDMKAGDAVMLALLEDFAWEVSRFEPLFVFYEREEGPYAENGLETVFEVFPWVLEAGLAIVPEPTENALEVGSVGTAQVEITFHGRAAHAARPWQGNNAMTAAGVLLAGLHERPAEKVMVDGLPFYKVLTPTLARGGGAKNVVPDSFWINVNHRFPPGEGREDVERTFGELLAGYDARFEIVDFAPSGPVDLDNPLVQDLISTGLEVRPKQAWTDVARFAQRGVPAVNFGPGSPSQAHQREEHVRLPSLDECYEVLGNFLTAEG
jgi:succinyl-diaminopimelate desuccinylase